jgi:hypothetical protein
MAEKGITEKILIETIAFFESAEPGNAAVAKLLREGIAGGRFKDSDWIAEILLNTKDSMVTGESPNEDPES